LAIPLAEGPNILTATATTTAGTAGTSSIQVTLDTTPPHVTITNPPDQFVTTSASITVGGSINDIVVGTVNAAQAQVTVNGTVAQVSNRMFLANNIALNLGSNVIQAVGRDQAGNAATTQITVTRQAPAAQPLISLVSGDGQTGTIGSLLPSPLVVAVKDASGNPVPSQQVIFKVDQNNGMVASGGSPAATVVATTNSAGQAQAQWTLGGRAGAGGNTVEAYAVGFSGTALFTASGTQGPAGMIVIDTGNNQTGAINQPLPKPLIAVVVDAGNNRLAGVPVTFTVKQGGGNIAGQQSTTVTSDPDGRVSATLTLGFQEGNLNNRVDASVSSSQGLPAVFTASGRSAGPPPKTVISGLVLDNSNQPIPGVTIRAVLTNLLNSNSGSVPAAATVQTNAQGQFSIGPAPVGFVKLLVDGSTAQKAGTYPTLDYDIVTIAGQLNTLGLPIFLLPLTTVNQLCVTPRWCTGTYRRKCSRVGASVPPTTERLCPQNRA
jgi:Glucodextranase, domain B